jgi:UDP-GlcNAc3NAcA epimerase
MYDNTLFYSELAEKKKAGLLGQLSVKKDEYVLVTIHRDSNTDDPERLNSILSTLRVLAEEYSIHLIMPLHPRTIISLKTKHEALHRELCESSFVSIIPPVSFLEMILLEKYCRMIITDSGGVQKESHFFKKPCIVLRKETEWVELIVNGTAKLVDADSQKLKDEFIHFMELKTDLDYPAFYGDGKTAEFILGEMLQLYEN